MECRIVDTTLRDGEQRAGITYSIEEKIAIAKKLDRLKVYQIEAGIPAMGGDEKESIFKIKELGLKSKISAWNRLNIADIQHSLDCGVDIVHIAVPVSDIQIYTKLNKDKDWVVSNVKRCLTYVQERGFEVTVGLEDASRAHMDFIMELCSHCVNLGVDRIRYADTVGILTPDTTEKAIREIKSAYDLDIEIHAHNDFGMAVANSIMAIKSGALYVDCTLKGIGERAGNCDYYKFIEILNKMKNTSAAV